MSNTTNTAAAIDTAITALEAAIAAEQAKEWDSSRAIVSELQVALLRVKKAARAAAFKCVITVKVGNRMAVDLKGAVVGTITPKEL